MSDSPDDGEGAREGVPDAVLEWLSSVAAERGVSETELLRSLLSGAQAPPEDGGGGGGIDDDELERVEGEFRELVEDVRERIVQVKRETDEKAPVDHTHHDLRSTLDQVGRDVGALEREVDRLDDRLATGFENYEEILTYLTETTDALDRKLGRLASVLIDLREQVGDAARNEVRRTALQHLTDTANRHGVEKAKCEDCGEAVRLGMLIEPRCPHCDSSFSALEPKGGFFRSSVLHTGTMPALESGDDTAEAQTASLESMVEDAGGAAPSFEMEPPAEPDEREADAKAADEGPDAEPEAEATADEPTSDEEADDIDDGTASEPAPERDGVGDLQAIEGVGPAYADRLESAGIDDVLALAVADPDELAEAIDVPPATVADWVEQADAATGES